MNIKLTSVYAGSQAPTMRFDSHAPGSTEQAGSSDRPSRQTLSAQSMEAHR